MEEQLAKTIRSLQSWKEIKLFESNVAALNRLTEEVESAVAKRSYELGLDLIADKTALNLTSLTPAEKKIVQAVSEYVAIMRQKGKYPGRTLEQLKKHGLIGAAENAVSRARPTQGFQTLAEADLEELSYERIVLDHPNEFSSRAIWFSRKTLGLPNDTDAAPANAESETQIRTAALVTWFKNLAQQNNGVIPPLTNADAAIALNMEDMQRFGQVHGNIQSRLDFACYLCNLPPLGLTMASPFPRAWSQQDRDWAFPVKGMQAAAQSRIWTDVDFYNVCRATESLPGQAHISWKRELAGNKSEIKDWAQRLSESAPTDWASPQLPPAKAKNPDWTRDELILALDLYLKDRNSLPTKDSPEIHELSAFLNEMGRTLGFGKEATFRNSNGVYMKMMNFRRFDTEYTKDGKVGLTRGNKDEELVWNEFSADPARLALVTEAIRAAISGHQNDAALASPDEPDICEAEEGKVLTRLHRVRERSRKLVDQAKKNALKKHNRLFCEACGFDFSVKYGSTMEGLIDAHHTKPVHTLSAGDKTNVNDLALLCANCHRVVHSSKRWLSISEVKELLNDAGREALP